MADLIENPSDYRKNPKYISDDDLRVILDILVRPGNLLNQDSPDKHFFHSLKLNFLSSNEQLIFNIRFMTLFNAELKTERVKPLFRQWESSE